MSILNRTNDGFFNITYVVPVDSNGEYSIELPQGTYSLRLSNEHVMPLFVDGIQASSSQNLFVSSSPISESRGNSSANCAITVIKHALIG